MDVPILKLGSYLIVTLQQAPTDSEFANLQIQVAERIGAHRARGVVLDVSMVDVLDSYGTRTLQDMAHTSRLRGADMVISGIQPDVAFAMAQLGLRLEGAEMALDVEAGLAHFLAFTEWPLDARV